MEFNGIDASVRRRRAPNGAPLAWVRAAVVAVRPDDGACLDWPYGTKCGGYGFLNGHGLVPAVVLEMRGEPRPDGHVVCHSCDRKVCVAWWHLSWGTYGRNLQEAWDRGLNVGVQKLTPEQAEEVRRLYVPGSRWRPSDTDMKSLAERYGVSKPTIHAAIHGNRKHS